KKDFLIDLVGYRRYGHNEMDEPRTTQPRLYQAIDEHPTVSHVFADRLQTENVIDENVLPKLKEKTEEDLRPIYDSMKENDTGEAETKSMHKALKNGIDQFETAVPLEDLKALNAGMRNRREGFNGFKKLEKILKRRENVLEEGN